MPLNTKTFLRQTSYAVSKDLSKSQDIYSRHSLRHAAHLNFQMTSRRHLLLCSGLRVAFSNRPLESDEILKVVTQKPSDPVYIPNLPSPKPAQNDEIQISAQSTESLLQQR